MPNATIPRVLKFYTQLITSNSGKSIDDKKTKKLTILINLVRPKNVRNFCIFGAIGRDFPEAKLDSRQSKRFILGVIDFKIIICVSQGRALLDRSPLTNHNLIF